MDFAVEKLLEKWEKLFQKSQQKKKKKKDKSYSRLYDPVSLLLTVSVLLLKREGVEGRHCGLLCVFI